MGDGMKYLYLLAAVLFLGSCAKESTKYVTVKTPSRGCTVSKEANVVTISCDDGTSETITEPTNPGEEPTEPPGPKEQLISMCHVPPGNPNKAHTIYVPESAVETHVDHGDYVGECL